MNPLRIKGSAHSARSDTRGAVYVEYLVAFLPFFIFFLCLWQVSTIYAVKLMVEHAALNAARAAAVVIGEKKQPPFEKEPEHQLGTERRQTIKDAALITLAPLIIDGTIDTVSAEFPRPDKPGGPDVTGQKYQTISGDGRSDDFQMVRVRIKAEMVCKIAFANRIACGGWRQMLPWIPKNLLGKPTTSIAAEAIFPYQGAAYTYRD